ncbi:uncharacterized protein METZ01_LOCUS384125, partial [marine metagenome]
RLHHAHPKNYHYLVYDPGGEFGGFEIFYDAFGYRVQTKNPAQHKVDPTRRIAFLGDSFTAANQVNWEQSFIGLIESNNPSILIRNFGVTSYSPILYLVQMQNEVKSFQPTDVIIQIYQNDFFDDQRYLKSADSQRLSEIKAIDGGPSSNLIKILRSSYLARLIRKAQLRLEFSLLQQTNKTNENVPLDVQTRSTETERKQTYETILLLKRIANEINARIFIFVVPNKELAMQHQCCDTDILTIEVKNFAASNNINFIDVAETFGNHPEQSKLFFTIDGHLTAKGHAATEEAISN